MYKRLKDLFFYNENIIKELLPFNLEIPKIILTNKCKLNKFNIENFRNQRLNNPSGPEIELAKFIPNAVREAPLIIDDVYLWRSRLEYNGIYEQNQKEWNRNLHQVDFLIPQASLIIETDSPTHSGRSGEDKARDEYLYWEFGLKVLRYDGYDFKNHLDEINHYMNQDNPIQKISYKNKSDEYFENYYSFYLYNSKLLSIIHPEFFDIKYKGIIITDFELRKLNLSDEKFVVFSNWMNQMFRKNIIRLNINVDSKKIIEDYRKKFNFKDKIHQLLKKN